MCKHLGGKEFHLKYEMCFGFFGFLEASGIDSSALNSFKLAKPQIIGSESSSSFEEWSAAPCTHI